MPKKRRVWYPGAKYHITSRGNRRNEIFKEPVDYYRFLKILEDLKKEHGFNRIQQEFPHLRETRGNPVRRRYVNMGEQAGDELHI